MVTPLPFPRPPEPLPHCTQSFAPDWYPFTGEEVHCPTTLSVRPSIANMEKSNKRKARLFRFTLSMSLLLRSIYILVPSDVLSPYNSTRNGHRHRNRDSENYLQSRCTEPR